MGESQVATKHSTHAHQDVAKTFAFISTFPSAFLSQMTLMPQRLNQADV